MQNDTRKPQDSAALCSMRLLVDLFDEKAKTDELHAKLWETDPKEYGTDAEGIALQKGRAEAWKAAAEMVKAQVG